MFFLFFIKRRSNRHFTYQRKALKELKRLGALATPQEKFYHLRAVNPFVFEEMILTALKRRGYKIIRNKRYTGDGGIDGQVFIKGVHYLIQAKRYKSHITAAHVQEFIEICNRRGKAGLFVHTGKTGKKSHEHASNTHLKFVSGQGLLKLLEWRR